MKRKFLIIPALCLTVAFGCDSDRRTAQSDGYQETEGLNEAEHAEGLEEANRDESLGGEGSFDVETERTSASGMEGETSEFITEAASSSMLEVELANLAEEKALSPKVKEYAQMIENDHKQANQKLKDLAQQKNINLPATLMDDHQDKMKDLREKSGDDFDKEYMSMQVDMHEKDIEKFESMKEDVQDQEIQQWVDNTLPKLREHKDQAQQLLDQLENENQPNNTKANTKQE